MDLEASEDQKFFQETTRRFLETETPLTKVRALHETPDGFERDWWRRGAELGWTSLLVSEADGGGSLSGQGLLDLIIVAEEMGQLASPGPLLATNVVAAAIADKGSEAQRTAHLPGIISGETVAAWALSEPDRPWDQVAMTAASEDGGFVLSGTKTRVECGGQADLLLVTAQTEQGLTQFLVPSSTSGVTVTAMQGLDMTRRSAIVHFDKVSLGADAVLGPVGEAAADVERQIQIALVLQCAEMAGAAQRVFDITVEWANDRFSFGRPLSSYQALKHRFADMKLWLEASHACALGAAKAVHAGGPGAAHTARVAKAYVGDHVPELMQDCVQMHGGIGVTWEHDLHLYLRRATTLRQQYGTPTDHRDRLATLAGL